MTTITICWKVYLVQLFKHIMKKLDVNLNMWKGVQLFKILLSISLKFKTTELEDLIGSPYKGMSDWCIRLIMMASRVRETLISMDQVPFSFVMNWVFTLSFYLCDALSLSFLSYHEHHLPSVNLCLGKAYSNELAFWENNHRFNKK